MYSAAKAEMRSYYRSMDEIGLRQFKSEAATCRFYEKFDKIYESMNEFHKKNPDTSPMLLKSRIHTLMADYCEPVIFENNPFFFEMGYNHSHTWGIGEATPASWLMCEINRELMEKHPEYAEAEEKFYSLFDQETNNVCHIYRSFDIDHHTLGYTKLFKMGIGGIMKQAEEAAKSFEAGSYEYDFCAAVIESCRAIILISHKFADSAKKLLEKCDDRKKHTNLERIVKTAQKIPENPPKTFYEGLQMLIFTREVIANMENMGISQLGHVDRLLADLYEKDIAVGRITEKEARELVSVWMMHTDIKFDLENNEWPETSTCIQLGGCDEKGNAVFNDVTKIFIEEHCNNKLVNPKLNCRYSQNSPEEYLKLVGRTILSGHNNFALINDDVIIDGLVKSGVSVEDARLYVNGGCQETMIEGFGHTEGAGFYVSALRLFDLFLREDNSRWFIKPLACADTFEEFYKEFISSLKGFFDLVIDNRNYRQTFFKNAISFPLFSATQEGCIESGKDHVRGGAKYNFATVALVGLANVADSLYSIKTMVYDRKELTLNELIKVLENNWNGNEDLHRRITALPKYGHNQKEVDAVADRFLHDVAEIIKGRKNERGGIYLPSTFVYLYNRRFAPLLRATPDGRRDFEYMASGCAPSLISPVESITDPINTMNTVDFSVCGGGISVMDVMLPAVGMNEEVFVSMMRSCSRCRCVTLQPNFVSKEDLLDAKVNPEKHKDLIVRICGLSAYFVALTDEVQDEIINRNFYSA